MRKNRQLIALRLTEKSMERVQHLAMAMNVSEKQAVVACIDVAYDVYSQMLQDAARKHLEEEQHGAQDTGRTDTTVAGSSEGTGLESSPSNS
jgi:hypothetical protein